MDVTMADPSPITIASLALSPRKTGAAADRPKSNIFTAGEERWRPTNASAFPTPCASDDEDATDSPAPEDEEDDDADDEALAVLPSPSRDPFKTVPKRPSLARQATLPANTKRLASAPHVFAAPRGAAPPPAATQTTKRPASAAPVTTSPQRGARGAASPAPKATKVPVPVSDAGSPLRKKAAEGGAAGARARRPEDAGKAALGRGPVLGRTLVELAQARAGGADRGRESEKERAVEKDCPLWDPERDEMPSPFLVRGSREVRVGLR